MRLLAALIVDFTSQLKANSYYAPIKRLPAIKPAAFP